MQKKIHRAKSQIHFQIQKALKNWLSPSTIMLEQPFPQIKRIADVVWPSKKCIFEVQVSPISAEEVRSRNTDYQSLGYHVIWILHERSFNKKRLTPAEIELRFSPHYFTNFTAFGKGFFYDQAFFIHQKRRIKRSARFPVELSLPLFGKQMAGQLPFERRSWSLRFAGDLIDRGFNWKAFDDQKLKRPNPFKIFFNHILEKFN